MYTRVRTSLAATVAGLILCGGVRAGSSQEPGSLLVFPAYDTVAPGQSILSITNTSLNPFSGPLRVRFVYVDGANCLEFDRIEQMTPFDTFTTLTAAHNPQPGRGYLVVYPVNASGAPISFNRLIGNMDFLDPVGASYSLPPFVFRSLLPEGALTDIDGDATFDLNGREFALAPKQVVVPRFFASDANFDDELILIDLSGGLGYQTIVGLSVFNDNEEPFTVSTGFSCWRRAPLGAISFLFTRAFLLQTNHDPAEVFGASQVETGWFSVKGEVQSVPGGPMTVPTVLATLVHRAGSSSAASPPFLEGTMVGALAAP